MGEPSHDPLSRQDFLKVIYSCSSVFGGKRLLSAILSHSRIINEVVENWDEKTLLVKSFLLLSFRS